MVSIDPATLKVIIHLLKIAIADEEARKRIMYIIAIPVVVLILLLSSIHYMFTLSLDELQEFFIDDYAYAEEFLNENGYGYGYASNEDFVIGDWGDFEAIDGELFEALMNEATKHIGKPYVWGGSNPTTSFDCSGFICWSYTKSGVYNLSRTTAQGIYNQCIPISESEAKAGDLVFFEGTYDSVGDVSHIGIFLGNGKMLHCGDPIGYANLATAYWQQHLYGYGRLPIFPVEEPEDES